MGRSPQQQGRFRSRLRSKMLAVGAGAAALALVAAGCSGSGSSPPTRGTPVKGGTAVFAEPPSTVPNYIFPFTSSSFISIINLNDFSFLMYRPLYWFGNGAQPTLNTSLSLADPATFSGTKVTITLKHYMWSNGAPVAAQDVVFWINMMRAVPQDWFGSVPGGFPTNVSDVRVVSATELTMTMKRSYSPTWFLYNNLSQITPMPAAWDRTASGPSSCATTVSDCAAVYNYLAGQAKDLSSYATFADLEHRGWAVEAERVQRRRPCHIRAKQVLLRPGQAAPGAVAGGAVHHRLRRAQRDAVTKQRHQDRRRLHPGR